MVEALLSLIDDFDHLFVSSLHLEVDYLIALSKYMSSIKDISDCSAIKIIPLQIQPHVSITFHPFNNYLLSTDYKQLFFRVLKIQL